MDPGTFRAELKQKKVRPAYLFSGDQELLKEEAAGELRRAVAGERGAVRKFMAGEARASEILAAQRNLSLLDPVGAVVVREANRLQRQKSEAEELRSGLELERAVEGPPVVFWDVTLDKRLQLFADISRKGWEIEFRAPNRPQVRAWIETEAHRLGHRLSPRAAEVLVELVGNDLLMLRSAIEKVSIAVGAGERIDEGGVSRVVAASRSHAFYELQDAVSQRDGARAVELFRKAVDEGEALELLVGVLFGELRRLLRACELDPRTAPARAAQQLGVQQWKVEKLLAQAKRFSPAELRAALGRLADVDRALKTGRGEPVGVIEEWIVGLCVAA